MAVKPLPNSSVPVLDSNGCMTPVWYEYFKSREKVGLSDLPDVEIIALTNGDAPVWSAVDNKWKNFPNI